MAGSSSNFDAATFRANLRAVMTMGLPNSTAEQPTFYFVESDSYPPGTALDEQGKPYDLTIMPTASVAAPVRVPVAVEWGSGKSADFKIEPIGDIQESDAVLTVFDTDYAKIKTAAWVTIGNTKYEIHFVEPPIGLFDVTVYRLHIHTVDET